jgi:hypothetical protein
MASDLNPGDKVLVHLGDAGAHPRPPAEGVIVGIDPGGHSYKVLDPQTGTVTTDRCDRVERKER